MPITVLIGECETEKFGHCPQGASSVLGDREKCGEYCAGEYRELMCLWEDLRWTTNLDLGGWNQGGLPGGCNKLKSYMWTEFGRDGDRSLKIFSRSEEWKSQHVKLWREGGEQRKELEMSMVDLAGIKSNSIF